MQHSHNNLWKVFGKCGRATKLISWMGGSHSSSATVSLSPVADFPPILKSPCTWQLSYFNYCVFGWQLSFMPLYFLFLSASDTLLFLPVTARDLQNPIVPKSNYRYITEQSPLVGWVKCFIFIQGSYRGVWLTFASPEAA